MPAGPSGHSHQEPTPKPTDPICASQDGSSPGTSLVRPMARSSTAATSWGDGIDAMNWLTRPAALRRDGSTSRRTTASPTASTVQSPGMSEMPEPAGNGAPQGPGGHTAPRAHARATPWWWSAGPLAGSFAPSTDDVSRRRHGVVARQTEGNCCRVCGRFDSDPDRDCQASGLIFGRPRAFPRRPLCATMTVQPRVRGWGG